MKANQILEELHDLSERKMQSFYFPCLITAEFSFLFLMVLVLLIMVGLQIFIDLIGTLSFGRMVKVKDEK